MGSPISPITVNLYMERFETTALNSYHGVPPSCWYRYVDDTWCQLKKSESDPFFEFINEVDPNIKFTKEEVKDQKLAFLDSLVTIRENGSLSTSVYRKPTHTDQYLLFTSHHPIEHKLGVVRTLNYRADVNITEEEEKNKEKQHIEQALKKCGYPSWAVKSRGKAKEKKVNRKGNQMSSRRARVTIPYVAGISEKIRRILADHDITSHFKPCNTIKNMLVHQKGKLPNRLYYLASYTSIHYSMRKIHF